ncbi:MAG: hypothetical protein M3421_10925, partial [Bacteroidota bacterium]|nr:hypothetical protein [Bacteroidota bacterium]
FLPAMEFEFKVNEDDFLTYQLFNASRSAKIKKIRRRNRSLVPILYLIVSIMFLLFQNYAMAFGFFLISVLWFVIYPMFERRRYVKQFKKNIAEKFKDKTDRNSKVILQDDIWLTKDEEKEAKFSVYDFKEINEIDTQIYIVLKSGYVLIIPKKEVNNIVELIRMLKELALKHSFVYNKNLEWEWR